MRRTKWYELYENNELVLTGSVKDISDHTDLPEWNIRKIEKYGHKTYRIEYIGTINQVFAFYIGDEFIAEGTLEQIAEESGELMNTLNFLRSDVAKTRNLTKSLIKLEGETVIVKRTHKERFAPIPSRDERREQIKVMKNVPVKPAEWKPNPYSKALYDNMFKRWA